MVPGGNIDRTWLSYCTFALCQTSQSMSGQREVVNKEVVAAGKEPGYKKDEKMASLCFLAASYLSAIIILS